MVAFKQNGIETGLYEQLKSEMLVNNHKAMQQRHIYKTQFSGKQELAFCCRHKMEKLFYQETPISGILKVIAKYIPIVAKYADIDF